MLRYCSSSWSLQTFLATPSHSCCSSCTASDASFILRVMFRSSPTSEIFTSCCVIVEPPWEIVPASLLARNARRIDLADTPSCS